MGPPPLHCVDTETLSDGLHPPLCVSQAGVLCLSEQILVALNVLLALLVLRLAPVVHMKSLLEDFPCGVHLCFIALTRKRNSGGLHPPLCVGQSGVLSLFEQILAAINVPRTLLVLRLAPLVHMKSLLEGYPRGVHIASLR